MTPLANQALARVGAATGGWPSQPDHQRQTFVTVTQKRFHLRSHIGDSNRWFFGINERFWNPSEWFVLACGGRQPQFLVIPADTLKMHWFPLNEDDRKLNVVQEHGHWFLRDPNPRIRVDEHLDAFESLR